MVERLEPRTLLSWTDYALVGAYYDIDAFAYSETGTILDDGSLLGELRYPGVGGPGSPFSSTWEFLDFDGPTFQVTNYEGFDPYVYDNGASFNDEYGAGWYLGDDDLFSAAEIAFIIERPDDASVEDFLGDWAFSEVRMSSDVANDATVDGFHGRWTVQGSTIDLVATGVLGTSEATWTIDSVDEQGLAIIDTQTWAWISDDGSVVIYVDMDLADGQSGLGVAVRPAAAPTMADVAGGFRVASLFSGDLALVEFALPMVFGDTYLDLDEGGTWTGHALDAWDAGDLSDPFGGTWSLDGDEVVLLDGLSGGEARYVVASNGSTLLGQRMVNDEIRDPFLAVATRDEPPIAFSPTGISTAARDAEGRAIAYEQRTNGLWYAVDLQTQAGGEGITGEIISWISVE
ncbi:MAG: hypothetical protein KDA28_07800, partial [Phycisphaerales bacterium]|nr:hypothetical protein [Phycisphaerales bacterium]